MRMKDVIALGFLALVSFPVILLGVLMWTGNVRLAFGPEDPSQSASRERLQMRPEDMAAPEAALTAGAPTSHMDGALGLRETDLDRREADVLRETSRLTELRDQDAKLRDTIESERKRIEALIVGKDSLEQTRLSVLARTFTSMKPDQAAKILQGLDDVLVTGVLRAVKDDKPRGKILAAIGKIDPERAAAVARLLRSVDAKAESKSAPSAKAPEAEKPATPKKSADSTKTAPAKAPADTSKTAAGPKGAKP